MADRDHLVAPEVWVEELDSIDVDAVVRQLLDILWQAFGVERCYDFHPETGAFAPRRL